MAYAITDRRTTWKSDEKVSWAAIVGICSMLDVDPAEVTGISMDNREVTIDGFNKTTFSRWAVVRQIDHPQPL